MVQGRGDVAALQPPRQTRFGQPQVVPDAQGRKQAEILEHHADAESGGMLWVTNDRRDAVEQYFAAVRAVDAQQQLHQRALARTIFTEQGEYLPRQNLQIPAIQSLDRAEALGDAAHIATHQSSTTDRKSTRLNSSH